MTLNKTTCEFVAKYKNMIVLSLFVACVLLLILNKREYAETQQGSNKSVTKPKKNDLHESIKKYIEDLEEYPAKAEQDNIVLRAMHILGINVKTL